jgi:2,4-diketo-3-deoxy-L-fuconate hydrolase
VRLASYRHGDADRIGFELGGQLYDLNVALQAAARPERYPTMMALIEDGERGRAEADAAFRFVRANPGVMRGTPLSEVRWHPPVRRPHKICGVAMNNSASDARKISAPDHPMFFLKAASSLIGHLEPIVVRDYYGSVHPEPELAVVIGRECKDVAAADALDCVYGYTILNDMTGNGMRAEDMVHYYALYPSKDDPNVVERREQHLSYAGRYKSTDTFGPMGPWLVTKDEVPDPHALDVKAWHKDEVIAEDSTAYYTYGVPQMIAFITRFHTLWPGDVISMGTAFRPSANAKRSLHTANITARGGPVSVEISGLGRLENPVVKE